MSNKRTSRGVGNLVVAVYGVFALSATVRAVYQLFRRYDEAPVAYWLSLVAAVVYILATYALATNKFHLAKYTMVFELLGVLTVGAMSLIAPEFFAHPAVWSYFGIGYGFIPLVLPVFGLWWISRKKN